MIGEKTEKVWLCNSREVIKIGKAGDNFGYVQDIQTLEEFATYGYNILPVTGEIKLKTVIIKQLTTNK